VGIDHDIGRLLEQLAALGGVRNRRQLGDQVLQRLVEELAGIVEGRPSGNAPAKNLVASDGLRLALPSTKQLLLSDLMAVIASTKGCSSISTVTPSCCADDCSTGRGEAEFGEAGRHRAFHLGIGEDLTWQALPWPRRDRS